MLTRLAWVVLLLLSIPAFVAAQAACAPQTTLKTGLVLAWTPPVQPASITTLGYGLDQQIDSGAWTALPDIAVTQTTLTLGPLPANHTYAFRLYAKGRLQSGDTGVSAYAAYKTDGTGQPCVVILLINAPTNFSATPQ